MITVIEQIKSLIEQLNIYRDEYYNLNSTSISDAEYDRIFER